eukprot:scaffold2246_cov162-Amphora_coffeaeformis.AAC.33
METGKCRCFVSEMCSDKRSLFRTTGSSDSKKYVWEQKGQTILGDDAISFFGLALDYSADGRTLASGAYARDVDDTLLFTGTVRVYEYDGFAEMWNQRGGDINGDAAFQFFGRPVALAGNERRVAIATASAGFPDVKVYDYDTDIGDWVQLGSNLVTAAGNGITGVAISADGYTVAVGRSQDSPASGFTRVFHYNIDMGEWEQLGTDIPGSQAGDLAGATLAISDHGRIVSVGSPQNNFGTTNDPAGFVSVYRFSCDANDWELLGSPIQGTGPAEKVGLYGLDMSSNGLVIAVGVGDFDGVAGTTEEIGQARVYYFDKNKGNWMQLGSGIDGVNEGDRAQAVSLNARGDVIAVGSPSFLDGTGHARIFNWDHFEDEWKQIGMEILGDNVGDEASVVALNACGDQVAVGIGGSDIAGNAAGAVRVYQLEEFDESKSSKGKKKSSGKMDHTCTKKGKGKGSYFDTSSKGKGSKIQKDEECYPASKGRYNQSKRKSSSI